MFLTTRPGNGQNFVLLSFLLTVSATVSVYVTTEDHLIRESYNISSLHTLSGALMRLRRASTYEQQHKQALHILRLYPKSTHAMWILVGVLDHFYDFEGAMNILSQLQALLPHNKLVQRKQEQVYKLSEQWKQYTAAAEAQIHWSIIPLDNEQQEGRNHTGVAESSENTNLEKIKRAWAIETWLSMNISSLTDETVNKLIAYGITENILKQDERLTSSLFSSQLAGLKYSSELEFLASTVKHQLTDQIKLLDLMEILKAEEVEFSIRLIQEFHRIHTAHRWYWPIKLLLSEEECRIYIKPGEWKKLPNCRDCCPPSEVAHAVERLVLQINQYLRDGVAPQLLAAWAHVNFINISPFLAGNEGVARAIGSLILMRSGLLPFHVPLSKRQYYLACLHEAFATKHLDVFTKFIEEQQSSLFFDSLPDSMHFEFETELLPQEMFAALHEQLLL